MSSAQKQFTVILFFVFYLYNFLSSGGLNCSNDSGHYGLAHAMYFDQTTVVDQYVGKYIHKPDYAQKDGKIYSDRLPGNAFLMVPFMAYANVFESMSIEKRPHVKAQNRILVTTFLPNITGALGLVFLLLLFVKIFEFDYWDSVLLVCICGFTTLNLLESSHLFSHAPSMLLITCSLYYCLLFNQKGKWQKALLWSFVFIGASVVIELQNVLFIIPVFAYLVLKNQLYKKVLVVKLIKTSIIAGLILLAFIGVLVFYNYATFGEVMLKSNKYNPFFPEEVSFLSALSGNFFEGLDRLFTNFGEAYKYLDWSRAVENETPGILLSSPVFVFSIFGFYQFFKKYRSEALLFISVILISVLIAAFHVTTLTRHVFTIYLLLYFPIIFSFQWILKQSIGLKSIMLVLFSFSVLLSFWRLLFVVDRYYNHSAMFSNFDRVGSFFIYNIPILLFVVYKFWRYRKVSVN